MKLTTCLVALFALSGCVGDLGPESDSTGSPGDDANAPGLGLGGVGDPGIEGGVAGEQPQPEPYAPCETGSCWEAPAVTAMCGQVGIEEDFSSGKYNVHERPLNLPAGVPVELTLTASAGDWAPALILRDDSGEVVHDGEVSASSDALAVELIATGQDAAEAALQVTAQSPTQLSVFSTGWNVVDSDFTAPMPTDAVYGLQLAAACEPPGPGDLLSPPNFDASDIVDGFYLLPPSDPPGLYQRKADDCSRGTKLLIDVIYTVATHWKVQRPQLAPIAVRDLNEGSCSTVDHATHEDGTHVDIVVDCATQVACQDNDPAIELAKLFVDTGVACGILNNDTAVQAEVNAYFEQTQSYEPWKGKFMRSVSGHTHHFHVRVKKPNGLCN